MAINKRLIRTNDEGGGASFNTVLYTGNGGTQSITGVGFQPDLTWIKERTSTSGHQLRDSVRGVNKMISSNLTNAEVTNTNVTSFDSDGFSLGVSNGTNESGQNYVAWNFKAGGAAVTNTDGTITSQVSANTEAGFSVVSYTGNGANGTVGHGLNNAPDVLIVKRRNASGSWNVYHSATGNNSTLILQSTTAEIIGAGTWGTTTPTTSVFTAGTSINDTNNYIAYCFAEVAGFSKFGSYTGNGLPLGPTITTGFEPAFVMVKRTNAADNWVIVDNKRGTSNSLFPDLSSQELSNFGAATFSSTGFTVNGASGGWNNSSSTYIYMAFANQF